MVIVWAWALAGCIQTIPRGPDFGPCAKPPAEGVYGFGEAGIGTCLAGPADLAFFQQDGGTFLAVTNADPFRHFQTGSLLAIQWDALAERLEAGPPERIGMHELTTFALELWDDDNGDGQAANPYLGGMGYLPAQQAMVVATRLSEDGIRTAGRDEIFVLDLTEMELPGRGIRKIEEHVLEDDPFPVVVDEEADRVYVGNLTDHSVSVLTSAPTATAQTVAVIDVAPGPTAQTDPLFDADNSGSMAEISSLTIPDGEIVSEDVWTMAFVEGTVRAWVPTVVAEGVNGLLRYTSGDVRSYDPSGFGFEQGLGDLSDPFVEIDANSGLPTLWFARADGTIHRAFAASAAGSEWVVDSNAVYTASIASSPSVAPLFGEIGLYIGSRDAADAPSSVVLATSVDGLIFSEEGTVLVAPPGLSYEDPFVVFDPLAGRYRMWLTIRNGIGSEIGLSESSDGRTFSEPVVVVDLGNGPAAKPVVALLEGRYGMWYANSTGTSWEHVFAWSFDGWQWTDPVAAVPSDLPFDSQLPPRMAISVDQIGGWRIEGLDYGLAAGLLTSGTTPLPVFGYLIGVASGHLVENEVIGSNRADLALIPGSAVDVGGRRLLFATTQGSAARMRIAVLEEVNGELVVVVDPQDMSDMLGLGAGQTASDPVVVQDAQGFVMYFTLIDADATRIRRSTSADALSWGRAEAGLLLSDASVTFDNATQRAHSIEFTNGVAGAVRLWYTGSDGSVTRIGSATAPSPRGRFTREAGATDTWRLGAGPAGGFDDSAVQDPLVVKIGDETHLYYAGFDGAAWHLGHATVGANNVVVREIDPLTSLPRPALSGRPRTFSALSVLGPVLWETGAESLTLRHAGFDGLSWRIGAATVPLATPASVYAAQRFPTAGDTLSFETTRGGPGAQVIELEQQTKNVQTVGWGMSGLTLDKERGYLYVTTKPVGSRTDDILYVLDVRDDTSGSFIDANYLDLEAIVEVDTGNARGGFRGVTISQSRGLAYLSGVNPDSIVVIDLTQLVDDGIKDRIFTGSVGIIPQQFSSDDAGELTVAYFGAATTALSLDERLLLVPHFRGNALSVIDLDMGPVGTEVAWLDHIGENPHVVKVSPDGRWAVVANYLGDVEAEETSATLAVVDLDPESADYLSVVTWLVNR